MTSKKDNPAKGLLPSYFKFVGLGIIILTILIILLMRFSVITLPVTWMFHASTLSFSFLLAGLLLIAVSRDKIEDEMTLLLRWRAMVWAFLFAAAYVIITPVIHIITNEIDKPISGQHIVLLMLIGFLSMFTYMKRSR